MELSLKTKLLAVIGLLGLVPIIGVGLNTYDLSLAKRASTQMDVASPARNICPVSTPWSMPS